MLRCEGELLAGIVYPAPLGQGNIALLAGGARWATTPTAALHSALG